MSNENKSTKARKIIDLIFLGIISIVVGVGIAQMSDSGAASKLEGGPAPVFALEAMDGQRMGAKDFAGKVVILDFWATWCPPCIKQMPALQNIKNDEELKEDVKILSINTDDPTPERTELVESFMAKHALSLDVLYDDGVVSNLYGVERIPTLVVIDPNGLVSYGGSGVLSEGKLRKLIREAKGQ
ncbi:TlpA family protein disulfide reductase [Microvenator marinus]|jgi:thiol-disulfide isomerase/thioredoxin|uniref:TlpA family protein disulfide reductase n=1 Tax=Microvenator marinus TaxID=2600177 RepID=A0A5B8XTH3_9DELT|nr:TlpA disulfide reductase family protein [Microvenator marinus]QED26946.1 TlpA family protein disulfide reductase [Microvenator marinus]